MIRYILIRFPNGLKKALTFSYDDCCAANRRLAQVFNRYHMKATFNLNSDFLSQGDALTKDELTTLFKGHEIAVHGASHRAPGRVTALDFIDEILRCRRELESITGEIIRGYAYPDTGIRDLRNGITYEDTRQRLQDMEIMYARSLGGDNDLFLIPSDFYNWVPTSHHENAALFDWLNKFLEDKVDNAYVIQREARLFYLWGHAYEFDRNNNWERIEAFCEKASGKDDIWYATNGEICSYVDAYRRLIFSVDKRRVLNPTATDVWFESACSGKTYHVPAGKTILLDEE